MSMSMDLQLGRYDVAVVGSNHRNTMRVLPSSKKKNQKVVIGDDTGSVSCFAVKKGETELVFKAPQGRREVTALTLGGSIEEKDKIYAAFGQTIQAFNKKKGALFFTYSTVLNEDIYNMFIEDLSIWTTCEYSLNVFECNKSGDRVSDKDFFQAPDKINHLALIPYASVQPNSYYAVLACQDKYLRMIKESELVSQLRLDGPATSVIQYDGPKLSFEMDMEGNSQDTESNDDRPSKFDSVKQNAHIKQLIYGTDNGLIGQVFVDGTVMRTGWLLPNDSKKPAVNAMVQLDVTLNGVNDLVVGRDDGLLEVFSFDANQPSPQLEFSRDLNESITSLDKGFIVDTDTLDLAVSTYSGKVLAFTHEVKSHLAHIAPKKGNDKEKARSSISMTPAEQKAEAERVMVEIKSEIEKLKEKVSQSREKYAKLSTEMIAVEQQFKIKSSFKLIAEEACYLLTIEIQTPIDVVTLQSNVPVMLMEVESNKAMVSRTQPDQKNGNELLATYRCQESTNRLEMKIRTVEGQHGVLNAYVIPKLSPKSCQKAVFQIKPLSLHEKVHLKNIEEALASRPLNSLTLTGGFSLSEIHTWVGICLPEVPNRLNSEEVSVAFKSTFLQTLLTCDYIKGKAVFKSDSITCISIMKEVITREATSKKISINISLDLAEESVFTFLNLLRPTLDHHHSLAHKFELIHPLEEIQTHEADLSFLLPEYKNILDNKESITKEFKMAPRHLDFLRGIVTDLFVDKHKLQGKQVQHKVPKLLEILENYDFNKLCQAFKEI